jgi:pimeloyl-ACP methyl ester carboxylesterase
MKRLIFASVLAASTLWFGAPARAALPRALPAAAASYDAGSLHVDVYGTPGKPALIFIPGLVCGPWEWSGQIAQFSNDYTIYALTLPGFNGQPAVTGDLFAKTANDFWELLRSRNIRKPIVVGHSLGGTLGYMLAEQHADRLRALIAVDGMPVFPGMETMTPAQHSAMATRVASMMSALSTPVQFEAAEKTYSLPMLMTSPADIAAVAPLTARSSAAGTAAWIAQDMALDLRPNLHAIAIPVLEIMPFDPALDPAAPGKIASAAQKQAYYALLLQGDLTARVQAIAPSRHFIMYDRPKELDDAMAAFISALP